MSQRSFWKRAFRSIKEFFLWLLERLIAWAKAFIEWLEHFFSELAKELNLYLHLAVVFSLGAAIYYFERYLPLETVHHQILSKTGFGISLGSVAMIGIQVAQTVLSSFGLLDPLIKLRDKALKKWDLL